MQTNPVNSMGEEPQVPRIQRQVHKTTQSLSPSGARGGYKGKRPKKKFPPTTIKRLGLSSGHFKWFISSNRTEFGEIKK